MSASDLIEQLKIAIKQKLVYHEGQSSEVIIKLDCKEEIFFEIFDDISRHPSNKELEKILGRNWHVRILNTHGESCVVINDSTYFKLVKRQPLKEYVLVDNTLQEKLTNRLPYLYFSFVKKYYPKIPDDFIPEEN